MLSVELDKTETTNTKWRIEDPGRLSVWYNLDADVWLKLGHAEDLEKQIHWKFASYYHYLSLLSPIEKERDLYLNKHEPPLLKGALCLVWLKSPEEKDKKCEKFTEDSRKSDSSSEKKIAWWKGGGDKHNQLALEEKMSGRYCKIDPCATSLTWEYFLTIKKLQLRPSAQVS